jgi:acetyl-CoA carboxylase carboxyl transferase subunit alpha
MFEHAVYSVISPEGCASILWRTADKAPEAAEAMKVTAQDLKGLSVIDGVVPEPLGGAHRDPAAAIASLGEALQAALASFDDRQPAQIRAARRQKFLDIGRR